MVRGRALKRRGSGKKPRSSLSYISQAPTRVLRIEAPFEGGSSEHEPTADFDLSGIHAYFDRRALRANQREVCLHNSCMTGAKIPNPSAQMVTITPNKLNNDPGRRSAMHVQL